MIQKFRIKTIVRGEEDGPFKITLNDDKHLIGDLGRAVEGYMQKGMEVHAEGHYHGPDFLIEDLKFLGDVIIGGQLNIYL
jgi:hypothetical protein